MPNLDQPLTSEQHARLRVIDQGTLWHPFTQMQVYPEEDPGPPIIVGGEGNWLVAADGQRFLDANSGYWCLALGCRPARVEAAVAAQLGRFSHSTLLGLSHRPALELAGRLTELAGPPLSHAFFASSGSEAVEIALKIAYQHQVLRGHPERCRFLAFGEAYHGDTLGAVAVGGIELFHGTFAPLLFPTVRLQPPRGYRGPWFGGEPSAAAVEAQAGAVERALEAHASELAALIVEPLVLGPGGILPHPVGFLRRVVDAARALGVPVIFDEVAVGMGRLGSLFAFQQVERKPDLLCLAKGLTAGLLPLSAVLASEEIYRTFLGTIAERRTFFHGHTFTGSALGCAAALETLEILTEGGGRFLREVREEKVPAFWRMLEGLDVLERVGEVRGRGMMAGIQLVKEKGTGEFFAYEDRMGHRVVLEARRRQVNLRAIGDLVLCVPPLTITQKELELLGRVLKESLTSI